MTTESIETTQSNPVAKTSMEPTDEQSRRGLEFLKKLVVAMQMDVAVTFTKGEKGEDGEELRYDIEGPDSARIIGKRGAVLEAIQYLTSRIVQRPGEERKHIMVDAEGYRARHEEQLGAMAKKLAADVAAKGKVITFDPMNARQRRVIHMAVKEVPGVRTESQGEGIDRRVQILPENHPGNAPLPPLSRRNDRGGNDRRDNRRRPPRRNFGGRGNGPGSSGGNGGSSGGGDLDA